MTMAALYSGFEFDRIPGVKGTEMSSSSIPYDADLRPAILGTWRAHANAWRTILENGWQTALILEDDADWHKNLKDELVMLSDAMKFHKPLLQDFRGVDNRSIDTAPYGMC